jgi:hypothetical protein
MRKPTWRIRSFTGREKSRRAAPSRVSRKRWPPSRTRIGEVEDSELQEIAAEARPAGRRRCRAASPETSRCPAGRTWCVCSRGRRRDGPDRQRHPEIGLDLRQIRPSPGRAGSARRLPRGPRRPGLRPSSFRPNRAAARSWSSGACPFGGTRSGKGRAPRRKSPRRTW